MSINLDKRISYTAADAFPIKIFLMPGLSENIKSGYIPPVHPSISPTNKCNQDCPFCSYSARDRELELSFEHFSSIVHTLEILGAKAIDITGGGEPLMHPEISKMIELLISQKLKMSLTTNGKKLKDIGSYIKFFSWIRISTSDYTSPKYLDATISRFIEENSHVNWDISYVATRNPNYKTFVELVKLANYHRMSHFRVVNDLLDLPFLPPIDAFKKVLCDNHVNDELVIYQDRLAYEHGMRKCLVSLIRPNIDAKGDVFPCCGTQYATTIPARDFAPTFNMGCDYNSIWKFQRCFDGSFCTTCYYGMYNRVLNALQMDVDDVEFT